MNNIQTSSETASKNLNKSLFDALKYIISGKTKFDHIKTILIKPVGNFCNLRCKYCYEGDHHRRPSISIKSIEKLYSNLSKGNQTDIKLAWHGGEPLLAGKEYYRQVFNLQESILNQKKITNIIQTNGYLLDYEWIKLFKEHNVKVGISLDGSEETHDSNRITSTGKGTFERVRRSIELMVEHDFPFGVITVIGKETPERLFRLCEELSIKNIDIHPKNSTGLNRNLDSQATSALQLHTYLIEFFDLWVKSSYPLKVNVFEEFFRLRAGLSPATCHFNGRCSNIIAIEHNGDILPCTRPFSKEFRKIGNLDDINFNIRNIEELTLFKKFIRQDSSSQVKLKSCKWYKICNNGCPQHREKNGEQDISGQDKYCNCANRGTGGYYYLWEHMEEKIQSFLAQTTTN